MSNTIESMSNFRKRAMNRTGCTLEEMRWEELQDGDTLPGPILLKRGTMFICADDYPDVDEDGVEYFHSFVLCFVG